VRNVKALHPEVAAGLLTFDSPVPDAVRTIAHLKDPVDRALAANADFVSTFHYGAASDALLAHAALEHMPVYTWTVDNDAMMGKLLDNPQIAGVITNDPLQGLKLIGQPAQPPATRTVSAA
jgi:glycerophosphoryl diester phosphodiesterase